MIIRLRAISSEVDDFLLDIEIGGNASFLDLHNYFQTMLHYDKGQMASFFTANESWEKQIEITLMDMTLDEGEHLLEMVSTQIKDIIAKKKQRILYDFDLFNERCFFIEVYDIDMTKDCSSPNCIRETGTPPPQILMDPLMEDLNSKLSTPLSNEHLDPYFNDDDDLNDDMISYTDNLDDF